jgi:SPX domain protein involved in polyphosphate accumulation
LAALGLSEESEHPEDSTLVLSTLDGTSTTTKRLQRQGDQNAEASPAVFSPNIAADSDTDQRQRPQRNVESIRTSPGEVKFFKLLHAEFQKAVHFFDRAIEEFSIREERVCEGMGIVKQQNRLHLWSMLAKSVYRLYTDLLLLETFCIMTYCSFSKILKKHDKVTSFETRNAYMSNIVNKANFTNYTILHEMIGRCEQLYSKVSDKMVHEGQQGLYEDARLFIEMIHQLNQQA